MKPRREALTPREAADWLEALPPVEIKTRLVDYLRWQAAHGKRLLHSAHYFRLMHYGYQPRQSTTEKRLEKIRHLTQGIGNGGG